jgi:hypothetical protein
MSYTHLGRNGRQQLVFGLLPEVVTAQTLVIEHSRMEGFGSLLDIMRLCEEYLCPGGVAGVLQVLPHVLKQHHTLLEAADNLPQHFAGRFHDRFEQRVVGVPSSMMPFWNAPFSAAICISFAIRVLVSGSTATSETRCSFAKRPNNAPISDEGKL